jgi:hypothetical protein
MVGECSRHNAEQFEFAFARRRAPAPRLVLTQLEFPLSIRRVRRRERPNFSEFKRLAMLLRSQKENANSQNSVSLKIAAEQLTSSDGD